MKEYISKAILLNVIERNTTWNTNEAFEDLIKSIPTVREVDICQKFLDRLSSDILFKALHDEDSGTEAILCDEVNALVQEMEFKE